jgi:uncharacterized RDD family membrane protein YckC
MARWRDVKKGKIDSSKKQKVKKTLHEEFTPASPADRIKAFITDMFMIMMPIMYITTYVVMDGKDSFQASDSAHWITMGIYGIITVSFWVIKGQTPGFKAYSLKLIDDNTKENLTFGSAIARYIMFIISAVTLIGSFLLFFRQDKKTLQDVLMKTSVIKLAD